MIRAKSTPLRLLLLLFGAVVLATGCAGKKRRSPKPSNGAAVRKIKFEGNGGAFSGRSDLSLRNAMEQGKNPPLVGLIKPRQRRVFLDEETLALDAWRLEIWYAHHGYFDARFDGWDIQRVRPERRKVLFWRLPRAVKITGMVTEGEPYTVSKVTWNGLKSLGGPALARIRAEVALAEGNGFLLEEVEGAVEITRRYLEDQSYAYCSVSPRVDVYPRRGRTVEVEIDVELGPSCTFGDVEISGLDAVPEDLVRAELPIDPPDEGERPDPYSSSALATTRRRLFGLSVFSVVNVIPELEEPPADEEAREDWRPSTVVPVSVKVVEGSFKQMRLGTGFLFEGGRQEAHGSVDFSHVNLFGRLVDLDWRNRAGYAIWISQADLLDDGLGGQATRGPIVDTQAELTFPHVPARGWQLSVDARYELGVEQGYRFSSPSTSPTLRWRVTDRINVEFGYHLRYFAYVGEPFDGVEQLDTPFALDLEGEYLLSYLRQKVTYSSRDDILFPRRGLYAEYEVAEAGGPVGGRFDFIRVKADHRAYVPIIRILGWRTQSALAFRLGGGVIVPYGEAGVPAAERLYLGGANDVRGWQSNRLGPYICDPDSQRDCVSTSGVTRPRQMAVTPEGEIVFDEDRRGRPTYVDVIPVGGLLSLMGSTELRLYTASDVGVAVFTDAGMAWGEINDFWDPSVQPSVGAGLRYKLDFGAIRLDLARRLLEPAEFVGEPLWNVHFGLSEAF